MSRIRFCIITAWSLALFPVFAQTPLEQARDAMLREDYAHAFEIYQKLADEGNAKAQHNLSILYTEGLGVGKDRARAVVWLEKAAAQKLPSALYELGLMHLYGKGGIVQYESPDMQAHNQPPAADRAHGIALIEEAANLGNMPALNEMAQIYLQGKGVPADGQKALQWLEKGVARGNSDAMHELAALYLNGMQGVNRDCRKALHWFGEAGKAGDWMAYGQISRLYHQGVCLPKNDSEAIVWESITNYFMTRQHGRIPH